MWIWRSQLPGLKACLWCYQLFIFDRRDFLAKAVFRLWGFKKKKKKSLKEEKNETSANCWFLTSRAFLQSSGLGVFRWNSALQNARGSFFMVLGRFLEWLNDLPPFERAISLFSVSFMHFLVRTHSAVPYYASNEGQMCFCCKTEAIMQKGTCNRRSAFPREKSRSFEVKILTSINN